MDNNSPSISHSQLWDAIDALAKLNSLTPSSLARKAGFNPSTFNPSKRIGPCGRPRWPSMESIAKILSATDFSMEDFISLTRPAANCTKSNNASQGIRIIPQISSQDLNNQDCFDSGGMPQGECWSPISLPANPDAPLYAVIIQNQNYSDLYNNGDTLVVSPSITINPGDKLLFCTQNTGIKVAMLINRDTKEWHLVYDNKKSLILNEDIKWAARIIWVSQ